ncbi:hypothetical protein HK100_012430 [Physocladia obscura]|uniref:DUF2087 domain-containing protein n=1 Tax=Physocladia obscura TaxID=109957 RepID=A0AAD5XHM5_9FUNG|nr:hypothetical protein HK100_012430 [Physocladia obscura]
MPSDDFNVQELPLSQLETIVETYQTLPSNPYTEFYHFYAPKDFDSPYIDVLARELYKREIIENGGSFYTDGKLKAWPKKKSKWEAVIRYIGTLIDPTRQFEQAEVMMIISFFLPLPNPKVDPSAKVDASLVLRNLVDMGVLAREAGGSMVWRTTDKGHPMMLGKGVLPRF